MRQSRMLNGHSIEVQFVSKGKLNNELEQERACPHRRQRLGERGPGAKPFLLGDPRRRTPRTVDIRGRLHCLTAVSGVGAEECGRLCRRPRTSTCMSGNEGSYYTKTAKTSPQTGSVTQPVSAPMSRSRVFARKCPKSSARTSGWSVTR